MSCPCNCPKHYYSKYSNIGWQSSFVMPTIEGDIIAYTFKNPWMFTGIIITNPLGAPISYPDSLLTAYSALTQNTYAPMLASMMIAAMYANRDYDEPDGITGYTPLAGDSNNWNGYFKNLLNDSLKPTNYNSFIALINKITNYWANRSTFTDVQVMAILNAAQGYFEYADMVRQVINYDLLLPPGTYSFTLQNLAPVSTTYYPFSNNCTYTNPLIIDQNKCGYAQFIDLTNIPSDINTYTQAYIYLRQAPTFNVVYGSSTVPYINAPNWGAFPGNPTAAIQAWLSTAMQTFTGQAPDTTDQLIFHTANLAGTEVNKYAFGLNNITDPVIDSCFTQYPNYLTAQYNNQFTWGTLALPAGSGNNLLPYLLAIGFSKSVAPDAEAPYSPLLYQFDQNMGGVANLKISTLDLIAIA